MQLDEKLNEEKNLSKDISKIRQQGKLTIYSLSENDIGRPVIGYSLVVTEDLQFSMWCNTVKVPKSEVKGLHKDGKVHSFEGVLNVQGHPDLKK